MSQFLLTDDGDFDISSRTLQITKSVADQAAQKIAARLLLWRGEWLFDTRIGFPWLTFVFIKNPDVRAIRLLLRQLVASVPAVESIPEIIVDYDAAHRKLEYDFVAQLNDGSTLEVGEGTPFVVTISQGATQNA